MSCQIFLTDAAAHDLEDVYDYIALHNVPGKADDVLSQIEKFFSVSPRTRNEESIPKNYWPLGFENPGKFFSNPTASSTGS